ncbi:hypothetical protein RMR21_025670 (plasmid) [Agrobacterium sp. rho-8.1]|nr:hypothetical protein [Agrobacterium sp. rho-8.1]
MEVWLGSVSTWVPDKTLSVMDVNGIPPPTYLVEDGFQYVPVSDEYAYLLAGRAVMKAIEGGAFRPDEIDAIVLCSESFWDTEPSQARRPEQVFRDGFKSELLRIGLGHARCYGVWMARCSNFSLGIGVAMGLVSSGQCRNVLVVTADRCIPGSQRVMASGLSVLGDASACCVVGNHGTFQLKDVHTTGTQQSNAQTGGGSAAKSFLAACRQTEHQYRQRRNRSISDASVIVAENYVSSFFDILHEGLVLKGAPILTPTKSKLGHAFSSDCLFNLESLYLSSSLPQKEEFALLNFGPALLGAITLVLPS